MRSFAFIGSVLLFVFKSNKSFNTVITDFHNDETNILIIDVRGIFNIFREISQQIYYKA